MRGEWRLVRIGETAHIELGQSPPSTDVSVHFESGLPFLQGNSEFQAIHPIAKTYCRRPPKTAHAGDVLISVRAPVGAVNVADRTYCIGRGLAAVRFHSIEQKFGYYALIANSALLQSVSQGTTFAAIGGQELRELKVPLPPLPEQRRIAEILDTLDEAIRKTEQVIAKLQQVKQGLLHDLLTRGIDENGELRDPERHPEQFKDSELGRIPREWEVRSLESVSNQRLSNGVFKQPSRTGNGVPLVNVQDLYGDFGIQLETCDLFDASAPELNRFNIAKGDIFFTRSSLNLKGIAHCNVLRSAKSVAVYECHLIRLRVKTDIVLPDFLALWCRAPLARGYFMGRAKQTTMTTISQPDILPMPISVPSLAEQTRIVASFDEVSALIECEQTGAHKLRETRVGLMDDLLTGRVRVPVNDEDAP